MAVPRGTDGKRRKAPGGGVVDERAKMTDWIQALAGAVAVLFAAVALIVAGFTYRDQQQINHDQLALNSAARQRTQQRFAARVAWWTETAKGKEGGNRNILVQNRSPVPIRETNFAVDAVRSGRIIADVDDIPPCAIRGYRIAATYDGIADTWIAGGGHSASNEVIQDLTLGIWDGRANLHFSDSEGNWVLTNRGLRPEGEFDLVQQAEKWEIFNFILEEVPALAAVATDCGEGG